MAIFWQPQHAKATLPFIFVKIGWANHIFRFCSIGWSCSSSSFWFCNSGCFWGCSSCSLCFCCCNFRRLRQTAITAILWPVATSSVATSEKTSPRLLSTGRLAVRYAGRCRFACGRRKCCHHSQQSQSSSPKGSSPDACPLQSACTTGQVVLSLKSQRSR